MPEIVDKINGLMQHRCKLNDKMLDDTKIIENNVQILVANDYY